MQSMIDQLEVYRATKSVINRHPAQVVSVPNTSADLTKAHVLLGWQEAISPEERFQNIT